MADACVQEMAARWGGMGATDEPREQRPSWAQQSEGTATEEPDFPVDPTLTQESSEQHPPQQKQEQQEQQEEKMEQQQEQQEPPGEAEAAAAAGAG